MLQGVATRPTVSAIARRIHGWSWQAVSIFLRRVFVPQVLIDDSSSQLEWAQAQSMSPSPV